MFVCKTFQKIKSFIFRGYRAVAHYGNIFGHYTEFHLFPDLELGIYTSINGVQGPKNNAMKHIAMYVGMCTLIDVFPLR